MPRTGAAIRQAGALASLAAASALMGVPAVEARACVALALHAVLLLGCATVLFSPAHAAVADLARRATEAARLGAPAGLVQWLGFAGIALYVASDIDARNEAAAEARPDMVKGFLPFVMFLAGVWAVYLSMVRGRGAPAPPPRSSAVAAAEAKEDPDGVEVNAIIL